MRYAPERNRKVKSGLALSDTWQAARPCAMAARTHRHMMNSAQTHIPAEGQKPTLGDLGWLAAYGLRALAELIRARIAFASFETRTIPERNRRAQEAATGGDCQLERRLARIGYVIPRLSDRLPWRSDCLIQAMAAQNWLLSLGIASEMRIGVELPSDAPFGAHAWLVHGDFVVTGGDIDRYAPILSDSEQDPAPGTGTDRPKIG
ncbi:lasso peptide biosynthesis B2 protein [Qipengyuania nanhaisediminis]|uniref:lasso peptide biosynthesis B2 protein n=1 Tax=Qipengyuania nanhaisediminis TaxID=604088 RepID=UPI0038B29436